MKAFQIKHHAHPREHAVSDIPPPVPAPGEVLVDVYAAGLNFFDVLQAQNLYQHKPALPFVLGVEFSGRVAADSPLPAGCPFQRGDRVMGRAQGAFAERVAVPASALLPLPSGLSWAEGAAFPVAFATAWEALVVRGRVRARDVVLVHAAAGGVGSAAAALATARGCVVIGTAGSAAKRAAARAAGCAHVLDYGDPAWPAAVRALTGGRGADVVLDPVGLLRPSLACAAWGARVLVVGFAGAGGGGVGAAGGVESVPADAVRDGGVALLGVRAGEAARRDPAQGARTAAACLDLVRRGVRPLVHGTAYDGLGDVARGLGDLEQRRVIGKAVVRVRADDGTPRPTTSPSAKL